MPISRIKHREELRTQEKYIVDKIFPAGTIHIIGGASGMGKTTWLFQQLYRWQKGEQLFGYQSHPCEWIYVSCDRSSLDTDRTLRRLGLKDWDAPIFAVEEVTTSAEPNLLEIAQRYDNVDLFVVEGLQGFIPETKGMSQNKSDMLWMVKMRRQFFSKGKTILTTTHSPKKMMGQGYESSRSNFLGTQSLMGTASTLISFDYTNDVKEAMRAHKKPNSDDRSVLIQGRDFPDIEVNYTRDKNGMFIQSDDTSTNENFSLDVYLADQPEGTISTSKQWLKWAESAGVSKSGLYRWLEDKTESGMLGKPEKGKYQKRGVN